MKNTEKLVFLCIIVFCASILIGCNKNQTIKASPVVSMSTDELIETLKDPQTNLFIDATNEAALRKNDFPKLAPILAQALQYPRRDSYYAAIALISMGEKGSSAIPYLVPGLQNDLPFVRAYSLLSLGSIGKDSKCAIPEIAILLSDKDPTVRGSAANALESITGNDLVDLGGEFNLSYPNVLPQDTPENSITLNAREWWIKTGQYINWELDSTNCSPHKNN